jgi:uncharacterized membrane protein YgcG
MPIQGIRQALHTKKIIKSLSDDEKKVLGQVLRDKTFIDIARDYHTSTTRNSKKSSFERMNKFLSARIEDPDMVKKTLAVTSDPKFDVARNRVATKLLVPRDVLPKSGSLKLTKAAQAEKDKETAKKKAHEDFLSWMKTAKIKNPKTEREVTVAYVLKQGEQHPAFKQAQKEVQSKRKSLGLPPIKLSSFANKQPQKNSPETRATAAKASLDAFYQAEKEREERQRREREREEREKNYGINRYGSSSGFGGGSSGFSGFGGGGGFSGGGGGSSF